MRLMLGTGVFAATGMLLASYGPQILSAINSEGLFNAAMGLFDPTRKLQASRQVTLPLPLQFCLLEADLITIDPF